MTEDCDVLVLGSGAAGLVAAVTAAHAGLRVIVAEKTPLLGGTTALSEGMIWIPRSHHAQAAGIADTAEDAIAYVRHVAGNAYDPAHTRAYVDHAPAMLHFLETSTPVRYSLSRYSPDYYSDAPGATVGKRALNAAVFDARRLGPLFPLIRPPLASTLVLGGMTITGHDLAHFFRIGRSAASTWHVAKMVARHALDRATGHPRSLRIGNGAGVIGALLLALQEQSVPVWRNAQGLSLTREGTRITGADLLHDGKPVTVTATKGVLLACGGAPGDAAFRARHYPHVAAGKPHHSLAPSTNTGDGLHLAVSVGARLETRLSQPAAWSPVSLVPQPDGTRSPFPHYIDRAKPGIIAVDAQGQRFVNEACPYQEFVPAMVASGAPDATCWLIADHRAQRRYGIGAAPPWPGRLGPFQRSGYLTTAATLRDLAQMIGVDQGTLQTTVSRFNTGAAVGQDPDFHRGTTPFNRAYGDAGHHPNPCLGPLKHAPYHAVKLHPGDIGTFLGLAADRDARVLDDAGTVIPGLYVAGNDMASLFGGTYPAAGITVGSAMTFGWIAARHMAGK